VEELSDKLYGSALVWILFHEVGHVVHRHRGYDQLSPSEARTQEQGADRFATETMRNLGVVPMGMVQFFMYQLTLDDNRFDYGTDQEWHRQIEAVRTHPLSGDRLQRIGTYLRENASAFGRKEPAFGPERMVPLALQIEAIGKLADDRSMHRTIRLMGTTATPDMLKPTAASTFWGKMLGAAGNER
jgi:predicted Zn-dependent protease